MQSNAFRDNGANIKALVLYFKIEKTLLPNIRFLDISTIIHKIFETNSSFHVK